MYINIRYHILNNVFYDEIQIPGMLLTSLSPHDMMRIYKLIISCVTEAEKSMRLIEMIKSVLVSSTIHC